MRKKANKAGDRNCEEAAIGMPGYWPCNKPAVNVVGWKFRTDKPIRMCAGCTDHNVKNRSGEIVCSYPLKNQHFDAATVQKFESSLPAKYFAAMIAAAERKQGDYEGLRVALGSADSPIAMGTVKSRLNRGRYALMQLVWSDAQKNRKVEPRVPRRAENTVIGAG